MSRSVETQSSESGRCPESRLSQPCAEIKRLQERIRTAHHAVRVLREKLSKERAAKAVLAARLVEAQSPLFPPGEPTEARDRFDAVHPATETAPDLEALRALVAALYRIALSRGARPAGLQLGAEPPADNRQWHRYLIGKVVGCTLTGEDGRVIAREGEPITEENLQAAARAGLLFELIITMRLPAVGSDPWLSPP